MSGVVVMVPCSVTWAAMYWNGNNILPSPTVPVDSYTPEDWRKLQAAVDALKSPVLDDTVELDPSAIGQYLHRDYVRSHSTPNIAKLDWEANQPGNIAPEARGLTYSTTAPLHWIPGSTLNHSFHNYAHMGATVDHSTRTFAGGTVMYNSEASRSVPPKRRARSLVDPSEEEKKAQTLSHEEQKGKQVASESKGKRKGKMKEEISREEREVLQLARNLSEGTITFEDGQFKNLG